MMTTTTARVYVGTYAKYNIGNLSGAWIDLSQYSDHDEFIDACKELHADESDPELMFQDFEGFPRRFYSESSIDASLWDEYLNLDDDDRELIEVYSEITTDPTDIDDIRDRFAGRFDREIDWAYQEIDDGGYLSDASEFLARYFDYESFLNDAQLGGDISFVHHNGEFWAFRNA